MGGNFNQTLSLDILDGRGRATSPKKLTAFVTITGTLTISAPRDGEWRLLATDTAKRRVILDRRNVQAGVPVSLTYKTGMHAQIEVEAIWSRKADTTLVVEIEARY